MDDPHVPLRRDVRLLGDMLGDVLREQEGEAFYRLVEEVRRGAKQARAGGFATAGLDSLLAELDGDEAGRLARAFGSFLSLANIAEQHHRTRRRRDHMRAGSSPQRASLRETFARLRTAGVPADRIAAALHDQRVDLVFTAHPTQATRRTMLAKHQAIEAILARLDRTDLLDVERESSLRALRGHILAIWLTDDVRRERPDPEDEARGGLAVVERVLWEAVPKFLRELDGHLRGLGHGLAVDAAPIRFASWMGGDRDGNPRVTAATTRRVLLMSRWMGLHLYLQDIDGLRGELSLRTATPRLRERSDAREPYRVVLRDLRDRVQKTLVATEAELQGGPPAPAFGAADLREALMACHDSIHATGAGIIADGALLDTLRRLATFGLHLLPLDIRQEADRHTEAIEALQPGYADWDEARRRTFLLDGLGRAPEPLPTGDEVLDTFHVLTEADPEALGAYVISMAATPSDLLAVAYLQHRAGTSLPVVPLFETAEDLESAPDAIASILDDPAARRVLAPEGLQVMIGYSDSAKGAGMLAAAWALHRCQERIIEVCGARGVPVTFFRGRGGTVGRGGGPAHQAITALPPGAVRGRIRFTEQGEVIQARFGLPGIAARSLEIYTTATLEATLLPPAPPEPTWRDAMDAMAEASRRAYRAVLDAPGFVPFFRAVTPVDELSRLNIGSRPAKRGAGDGPGSLRAIPWVFAWMQNRLMLPAWLGTEAALATTPPAAMREWPFWKTTLQLLEMVLTKCDADVFAAYQELGDEARGEALLARLEAARAGVLAASGHAALLEADPVLARSIRVRNPYLDPLHLLQVQLLRRVRAGHDDHGALLSTITAIAAGLRNTG